jgi:serine/threonine protein kinase
MYQHANATPIPPSQRSELEIPRELDSVILACLAKLPEDRPQTAGELSHRLAAAVNGDGWTEEHAHRWWDRHHPECAQQPCECEKRMLTKTMEAPWEPVETPTPELDPARA